MLDTITGTPRNSLSTLPQLWIWNYPAKFIETKAKLIIYHNEKAKEYISDAQQNIIELHRLVKWL